MIYDGDVLDCGYHYLSEEEFEKRPEMYLDNDESEELLQQWEKWIEKSDGTGNIEEFHKMLEQNGFKLADDGVIIKCNLKGE